MSRLNAEHQRLFAADAQGRLPEAPDAPVRALVLALQRPADWTVLAPLWRGVQTDFLWPEAAIAVNGRDGFEVWFSLAEPLARDEAAELLVQLQRRYLGGVPAERLRAWPGAAGADTPICPPFAAGPERWAAFVTPDLPSVFGDDPALDFEPGADAQADLLSRLRSVGAAGLRTAGAALGLHRRPAASPATVVAPVPGAPAPGEARSMETASVQGGVWEEPRAFLMAVMNDRDAALALRIEAAKALLQSPPAKLDR